MCYLHFPRFFLSPRLLNTKVLADLAVTEPLSYKAVVLAANKAI